VLPARYYSGDSIYRNEMGRACGVYGRDAERVLKGRPENRRPLGKPRRRWEDNNKMHLQQVG
jgi:hypothetical protein